MSQLSPIIIILFPSYLPFFWICFSDLEYFVLNDYLFRILLKILFKVLILIWHITKKTSSFYPLERHNPITKGVNQ